MIVYVNRRGNCVQEQVIPLKSNWQVTGKTERKIRDGFQDSYPRTSDDIRAVYEKSTIYADMTADYDYPMTEIAKEHTKGFRTTIQSEKHTSLPNKIGPHD